MYRMCLLTVLLIRCVAMAEHVASKRPLLKVYTVWKVKMQGLQSYGILFSSLRRLLELVESHRLILYYISGSELQLRNYNVKVQ